MMITFRPINQSYTLHLHSLKLERRSVQRKGKEEYLYSAFYMLGMDHTVLPANTPCLLFLRKRSPDGAIPD